MKGERNLYLVSDKWQKKIVQSVILQLSLLIWMSEVVRENKECTYCNVTGICSSTGVSKSVLTVFMVMLS